MRSTGERRPRRATGAAKTSSTAIKNTPSISDRADTNAEDPYLVGALDDLCAEVDGYLVLSVVVDDAGHRRTFLYRSAAAAQRAVERAHKRGRHAHVTLATLRPVGVVAALTGGRR